MIKLSSLLKQLRGGWSGRVITDIIIKLMQIHNLMEKQETPKGSRSWREKKPFAQDLP